ncbi:MAG: RNA-guided pseudouridylation complex pseudouridine synthase subunit Cbf5 [Candidatus Micrarchaeota archaeon]
MLNLRGEKSEIGTIPSDRSMAELMKFGIVIIDKPQGPSSHEVSAFVRKILGLSVTGHTGTLDQNVSGVLVVLLEESRKVVSYIVPADKTYICLMKTEITVDEGKLKSVLSNFHGQIYQRPPMLSAVAKRLRTRRVHELKILEISGKNVLFSVKCEAGTYIRKIVSDAGEMLGVGTEMAELRRTHAGDFSEKDSITLQNLSDYFFVWKEFGDGHYLRGAIHPVESLQMRKIIISDEAAMKIRHGIKPKVLDILELDGKIRANDKIGLFTGKGELIAMAESNFPSDELEKMAKTDKSAENAARISRVIHPFG